MILTILIFSIIIILTLGYTTYNLLKKVEKAEDILAGYLIYLDTISRIIELSDERMKKLSLTEAFKSDDEVGFFFNQISSIQNTLTQFILKNK